MGIESDAEAQRSAAARRDRMTAGLIRLKDDHEAFDRMYFIALSPAEKMALVMSMYAEQWLLGGGDAEQLRLRRDIVSLQRRKR